jgi:hypothetical protein
MSRRGRRRKRWGWRWQKPDAASAQGDDAAPSAADVEPDYTHACTNCGETPVVPLTGLCGPCTFGEADTANGNW